MKLNIIINNKNMKSRTIILTLMTICLSLFISCNENEENLETYSYVFMNDSKLEVKSNDDLYIKYGIIEKGENVVFEYEFVEPGDVEIADSGYSETIRFEIDTNLNEFSYSNEELEIIKPVFTKYCFCSFENNAVKNVNPTGKISGKKLSNNQWEIDLDITFYGDENKKIKEIFKLK